MPLSESQRQIILHVLAGGKIEYKVGRKGPRFELIKLPIRKDRITRSDKYNITIDEFNIRATDEQKSRIRKLNSEQLDRFRRIMGDG